jgi:hypothetical protein
MRRIFLVISMTVAIGALWAVSAIACFPAGTPTVCAPAAYNTNGPGSDHNNAPPPSDRATLPVNDGTNKAQTKSPAIEPGGCPRQ